MKLRITLNDILFLVALVAIPVGFAIGVPAIALVGIACAVGLFGYTLVRFLTKGGLRSIKRVPDKDAN